MDLTGLEDGLPVCQISEVETSQDAKWLIEDLWLAEACGLIGGQPKVCKSWLGLDMAVSVASGTPCLGHFLVKAQGPTLVFLAEDAASEVRQRVDGISKSRGIAIAALPLSIITAPTLRLDFEDDQKRLAATIAKLKPKLVLLDPLVRLHRLDENNAREISGLLGYLRELQRQFHTAIVLTHHSSKRAYSRPGQGLRGSSDLHAFGDSNAYLTRRDDQIELTLEHRSASALEPIRLELQVNDEGAALRPLAAAKPAHTPLLEDRIVAWLEKHDEPIPRTKLRAGLKVNNQKLTVAVDQLIASKALTATATGLQLLRS